MISSSKISNFINDKSLNYEIFEITYDENDIKCINDFNIQNNIDYEYFGSFQINTLNDFLKSVGKNTKDNINNFEKIINNIINIVLSGYKLNHFCLFIRTYTKEVIDYLPRWHTDDNFFENQSKFITSLKGPGTLFISNNESAYNIFIKLENIILKTNTLTIYDNYNKHINNKLKIFNKFQITNNQGIIFFMGKNCPIHSEPNIINDRFFISIIPGTETQINDLKKKYI